MNKTLLGSVAFVFLTNAAVAEPRPMSETEMAGVAGGLYDLVLVMPITVVVNSAEAASVAVGAKGVSSSAVSNVAVTNVIEVDQSSRLPEGVLLPMPIPSGSGLPADLLATLLPSAGSSPDGAAANPRLSSLASQIEDMLRSRYLGPGW